jgi:hypothetical protein
MTGRRWALVAGVVTGLGTNAASQSLYGSLVGTGHGWTRRRRPWSAVTVTQLETNQSRSVVTSEAGS